ncbi:leucine rich repeat protein [Ichthyophthirius multifiliis]|uniref:Leucine rich repeat protein n=1 Tax=Ichthyophthirius multifiliis TaxID=5932 RepID=G0QYW6_ICHMU|nr:leucine rich repeat protein [Ichthyophthirius multifiliis]EGR29581.1 leucine rich repeat protein [Ichthyophthirius multifiliis]|eukprot:XP_004030817.1 leucine rich repeat protein [Ichthyophthirius multifiliis]
MGNNASKKEEELKKQKELEEKKRDNEDKQKAEQQKQIDIAVRFLAQPSVQKTPEIEKRIFLRKKGLQQKLLIAKQQGFLSLRNENIEELNPEIFDIDKCLKLQSLTLRNNNISLIPKSITNLQNLKIFIIQGNNLDQETVEIMKNKGIQGLFQYLKETY